ncbi:MAG: GTPase, partial [Dethiobacteria bacterium]
MKIGLVGFPQSGKTTLFNLLTGSGHEDMPGAAEVHLGSAVVPDKRLDFLADLYKPRRSVPAQIQFKDIPGVSAEASAAFAARMLEEVRSSDLLVQVVRAFREEEVEAALGEPDPYRDLVEFRNELLLADMDFVEKRLTRLREARKIKGETARQIALLERILEGLEEEKSPGSLGFSDEEAALLAGQSFLSDKPWLAVLNVGEEFLGGEEYPGRDRAIAYAREQQIPLLEICARIEREISLLPPEEQAAFMADYGLTERGIDRLARKAYQCLGLISFFTVGEDEVRAWT